MKPFFLTLSICLSVILHAQIFPVGSRTITWTDPARGNRSVGVQFYYPAVSAGSNTAVANGVFPFVVFGHGFQITATSYPAYSDTLAKLGYIVALPTTEGSLSPSHSNYAQDFIFIYNKLISEGTSNASSPFYQKVSPKGAIGGHSMGGGATVLSAQYSTPAECYFTFAAANTNPSSIAAAKFLNKPYLAFAGSRDCVAPPTSNQRPMYDSATSACKYYINILDGTHCQFSDQSATLCYAGEGLSFCSNTPLSITSQQRQIFQYLIPYLRYYLKGDCSAWTQFENVYSSDLTNTKSSSCSNIIPSNPSIAGPSSFCNGGSATLTAQPAGFSYLWNDNSTSSSLNASAAGTYSVVVGNGTCSLSAVSVSVAENFPPTVISSITGNDTVCSGIAGVTFSVPNQQGVTFNWSVPGGWNITSSSNTNSITVTSGTVSGDVAVTAQNNCGTTPSVQKNITVVPSTLGTPGNITGNTSLCSNQSGWYSINPVSGATSYNWNVPNNWISSSVDSNAIQLTPPTGSSSTQISVSASNSCGNSTASTFNITFKQSPQISAVNGPVQICQGNGAGTYYAAVELDVDSFHWNIPSGWSFVGTDNTPTPIINITASGTLTVNGYNECGTVQFQLPIAVTDTPQPVAVIQGNGVSCTTSGSSYQWYFNGNLIPNETGQSIANVTSSGNYSVVVTDNNGCVGTSQPVNYNIISVGDISDNSIIEIYPNPIISGDFLQIRISAVADEKMLQLCYLDGRVLSSQSAHAGLNQMSTKNLAQGVYLLRYDSVVEKIVVR